VTCTADLDRTDRPEVDLLAVDASQPAVGHYP
jgi:hypothetical protein